MKRRRMLALLGTTVGAAAGGMILGREFLLPPAPSAVLRPPRDLSIALFESLEGESRRRACVPFDHPLRQYHNRGVRGGGLPISAATLSREQRSILTDLLHAGLSAAGRERVPNQFYLSWPGVHLMNLLICGDPRTASWQVILSGAHLMLRLGGAGSEGVAFGGPIIYGDQRGDFSPGLPRNVYRYQYEAAGRLLESLDAGQRSAAILPRAPIQTRIELQGGAGEPPGVAVASLPRRSRAITEEIVDGILSTWPDEDVAYSRRCLEANGGIDALHASWYEESEDGGCGDHQIFRLEGAAAVFYFRGWPHVHAFVNIGMDGDRPLSVGEVVGENPALLEGAAVRRLFEAAMKEQAGSDFAFYGEQSVVGRLRSGTIRTGDIYTLESWQDSVTVVELKGSGMSGLLLDRLRHEGHSPDPRATFTVAVAGFVEEEPAASAMGRVRSRRGGAMLREAAIAYLKARGFASLA